MTNKLSQQMEEIFNHWSKVRITDAEVKKLVQIAMTSNKETLQTLQNDLQDELSTCFVNMCDAVLEYTYTSPTQQQETTKGTLFWAYNAVTGYFQNIRSYKDDEAKFKPIMGGTAQIKAQKAFDLCTGFAVKGSEALILS